MDYSAARFWFDILQSLFMVGVSIYVWWSNKSKATRTAIDRVDARVSGHETRLLLIEQDIKHQPGNAEIGEIHQRVDQVGQGLARLEGEMKQANLTLQLIQQHLLEKGQ